MENYDLLEMDALNGLTSILINNKKSLLIGTGIAVAVAGAFLLYNKTKKRQVQAINQPQANISNGINPGIGSIAI